jgi:hypothetical protein
MINAHSIYKYVAACTDKYGVQVKWKPKGVPSTNGKVMNLPTIPISMSQKDVENYKGWVKHETNHLGHSDFESFHKDKDASPLLQMVMNILEDERIDHLNDQQYEGDRLIHEAMEINELQKHSEMPPTPEAASMAYPLLAWAKGHDKLHSTGTLWSEFSLSRSKDKSIVSKLAKYDKRFLDLKEMPRAASYKPLRSLAHDILKEFWPEEAKKSEELQKAMVEAMESAMIHFSHATDKEGAAAEIEGLEPGGRSSRYSGVHHNFSPSEITYVKGKSLSSSPSDVIDNSRGFVNAVRQALQVMTRKRTEYGVKRGKLHAGLYHRLLDDNPKVQQKVFKHSTPTTATDCAVTLLVDYSGSMGGEKIKMAKKAAASLCYITEQMIGVPTEILTFTDDLGGGKPNLLIGIAKEFGEKVPAEVVHGRLHAIQEKTSLIQNCDGEALLVAYHRIKHRKEKRKLIIVLSDGAPASYAENGDQRQHTLKVTKEIQASGVELYGVGIEDSSVEAYYKEHIVINNIDELIPSLLTIVKRKIVM